MSNENDVMEVSSPMSPQRKWDASKDDVKVHRGFWATELPEGLKASCDVMWSNNVSLDVSPSTVRILPIDATTLTDVIVMMPGNPGVVDWYETLCLELVRRSNGAVAMVVMGYAGHHSHRKLTPGHWYNLQDQIELGTAFMTEVVSPSFPSLSRPDALSSSGKKATRRGIDGVKVHVAGHSIGSFVACHLGARFPQVRKVFLLTPTVCNMKKSPNGVHNKKVLHPPIIRAVATLASCLTAFLPTKVQSAVVSVAQPRMDDSALALVLGMGSYSTVRNVLTMAHSEFEQLTTIDPHLLGMVEDRAIAYFVRHDGWVPMSDVKLFRDACPAAAVVVEDDCDVAHAWCLHHNDEVITNGIAPFIDGLH